MADSLKKIMDLGVAPVKGTLTFENREDNSRIKYSVAGGNRGFSRWLLNMKKHNSKKHLNTVASPSEPLTVTPVNDEGPQVTKENDCYESWHDYENMKCEFPPKKRPPIATPRPRKDTYTPSNKYLDDITPKSDSDKQHFPTAALVRNFNKECEIKEFEDDDKRLPPSPPPRPNHLKRSTRNTNSLYVNTAAAAIRGSDEQDQPTEKGGEYEFEIHQPPKAVLYEQTEQMAADQTEPGYEPINPNNSEPLNEENDSGPDSFEREIDETYARYEGRKHSKVQEYSEVMAIPGTLVRDPHGGPSRLSWKDADGKEILMLVNVEEKPGK